MSTLFKGKAIQTQTKENPWDKYEEDYGLNTVHTAEIAEIVDKGATIKFNDDITAFVLSRHLEKEDGKQGTSNYHSIIEIVQVLVVCFNCK